MEWSAISGSQAIKGPDHPEFGEGSIPSNANSFCLGDAVGEA